MATHLILPEACHAGPVLPPPPGARPVALQGHTMGTSWSLRAHVPARLGEAELRRAIEAELMRTIALFSPWEAASEISRLNRDPRGRVELSATFCALLAPLLEIARQSGGASDPTLGRLIDLWGFGPPGPRADLPDAAAIAAARATSGHALVQLDVERALIERPPGLQFDLGGSAKGWAVDQVSAALTRCDAGFHLIEIGGECFARGLKPDMYPWWVDILPEGEARFRVGLNGMGLATSGDALAALVLGGRRFAHTIDGRSGWPAEAGAHSASVLADSTWKADALASVFMVLDGDAARAFARDHGVAVLLQNRGQGHWFSPAMAAMAGRPEPRRQAC